MPAHLAMVTEVGRDMLTTESGEKRLDTLLTCFIGEDMPADAAIALESSSSGSFFLVPFLSRRRGMDSKTAFPK